MCDNLHYFELDGVLTVVALPFDVNEIIAEWDKIRAVMAKKVPSKFTRDEWAYLMTFMANDNLVLPFREVFGQEKRNHSGTINYLVRPRGPIALWLPNNVSLLGPLMLVLLSLSGNPIWIKSGSQSENLTRVFFDFLIENLPEGTLSRYLNEKVIIESLKQNASRHSEIAQGSATRIVFGSSESAKAIEALPHPIDSTGIYFVDKQSEAWAEKDAMDESTLVALIRVFGIYGQAGCTSPRRVVIIGGTKDDALDLCSELVRLWPAVITQLPFPNIASANVMALQWARALGWDATIVRNNAAVIAVGEMGLPTFTSPMSLPIVWGTIGEAIENLPDNIQTLGYAANDMQAQKWIRAVTSSGIKRFVPIASMHHFGHVWDGYAFWQQLFERVSIELNCRRQKNKHG